MNNKTVKLYRKRPTIIEAIQFDGLNQDFITNWVDSHDGEIFSLYDSAPYLLIGVIGGTVRVNPTDWVIRGIKGEFYPCRDDIFDGTYEPVLS